MTVAMIYNVYTNYKCIILTKIGNKSRDMKYGNQSSILRDKEEIEKLILKDKDIQR